MYLCLASKVSLWLGIDADFANIQWSVNISDSATDTKSDVPTTRKCLSTRKALQGVLKNVLPAIEGNHNISSEDAAIEDVKVDFLAEGGYNYVWLVSFSSKPSEQDGTTSLHTAILREPNDDAFLPWQIENEVAHLTFIAKDHPSIPVPKVYAYDDGKTGNEPYITMEYIDGQPLDSVWTAYSEDEKLAAARQVAQTIIEMGTITFDRIGGLTLEHEIGPTVEASSPSTFLPEQPFTLVHNDLNGRNIMMRDKKIAAILDWEFAGSYPLSEMLEGRGVDLLETVDDETEEENSAWSLRMGELVAEAARARGWDEGRVELLVGRGNEELGLARIEMVPDFLAEDASDIGAGNDADNDVGGSRGWTALVVWIASFLGDVWRLSNSESLKFWPHQWRLRWS
ncbi:hypothetical protein HO133_008321 [Letharia lupina]|uniref:Protein kinase domain-containing protein n=1 Tax=Letharia lupina TaxID=560253 RepID=A0A8H6FFY4_9LECA|nr:uncharacterized protein HO133_008321 [Letharia lupina]KAF6226880.1 hypothetical protein HO133_008321 [Letharia lupina]